MHPAILALAAVSVSLNALAQIGLRKTMLAAGALPAAASDIVRFVSSVGLSPWFLGGMTCYALSIGLWLLVLAKTEVSLAYPLLSIGYVITAAVGHFYLGESVGYLRLTGIALICAGIVFVSRSA
jgi:multidrug transporter EmrE-like cation transporter